MERVWALGMSLSSESSSRKEPEASGRGQVPESDTGAAPNSTAGFADGRGRSS